MQSVVAKGRSIGLAILYILIGGIVGSILGRLLTPVWAPLGRTLLVVGARPGTAWSVDLGFMGIQLGVFIELNVLGVIGLVAGLMWYRRV